MDLIILYLRTSTLGVSLLPCLNSFFLFLVKGLDALSDMQDCVVLFLSINKLIGTFLFALLLFDDLSQRAFRFVS